MPKFGSPAELQYVGKLGDAKQMKGGSFPVADNAERDALITEILEAGMHVFVRGTGKTWKRNDANDGWVDVTAEQAANKVADFNDPSNTTYPTTQAVWDQLVEKQDSIDFLSGQISTVSDAVIEEVSNREAVVATEHDERVAADNFLSGQISDNTTYILATEVPANLGTTAFAFGRPSNGLVTGSNVPNQTFVNLRPLASDTTFTRLWVYKPNALAKTLKIGRYIVTGSDAVLAPEASLISVSLPAKSGIVAVAINLVALAGENIGYVPEADAFTYVYPATGDELGYLAKSGEQTSFTSDAGATNIQLQVGLTGFTQDATGALLTASTGLVPDSKITKASPGTSVFDTSIATIWAKMVKVGSDVFVGDTLTFLNVPSLSAASGAARAFLKCYLRPSGNSDSASPQQSTDILVWTTTYSLSSLGLTAGGSAADCTLNFPKPVTVLAGYNLFFEWGMQTSRGVLAGCGTAYAEANGYTTGLSGGQIGWYYNGAWNLASANVPLAFAIGGPVYRANESDLLEYSTSDQVVFASAQAVANSVYITGAINRRGSLVPFSGSVALTAPTSGTATDEAVTLRYNAGLIGLPFMARTAHRLMTAVTVKNGATVLTLGTDYIMDATQGGLARATSGTDISATVTYTWSKTRYDLISINPVDLSLHIDAGTEGDRDAIDRMPELSSSRRLPLFMARSTSSGITLFSRWDVDGFIHRKLRRQWAADTVAARKASVKFRSALKRGNDVSLILYGDSITHWSGGTADPLTPNGQYRDRLAYLTGQSIGSDLTGAITATYPSIPSDGAGNVHTRASFAQIAAEHLRGMTTGAVRVLNMSIAGSSSYDTTNGDGTLNGTEATRLAALGTLVTAEITAGRRPLVLIEFGMNELGYADTEANVSAIIWSVFAAGGEALVMGCPRPAAGNLTDWRYTCDSLRRAAEYPQSDYNGARAGYIDTVSMTDDGSNVFGVSTVDWCSAQNYNHPGIYEHQQYALPLMHILGD